MGVGWHTSYTSSLRVPPPPTGPVSLPVRSWKVSAHSPTRGALPASNTTWARCLMLACDSVLSSPTYSDPVVRPCGHPHHGACQFRDKGLCIQPLHMHCLTPSYLRNRPPPGTDTEVPIADMTMTLSCFRVTTRSTLNLWGRHQHHIANEVSSTHRTGLGLRSRRTLSWR